MSAVESLGRPQVGSGEFEDVPFLSIIVPTFNRAHTLPYLFAALARQIYRADRMEVLVVDNSSADATESVVARWASVLPFDLKFERKENHGPAASRNLGAARARGEFLIFTDSDCIPTPRWLLDTVRGFASGADLVCGPFLPVPPTVDEPLLSAQQAAILCDRGCYPTANLAVRESAFVAAGGFDESFGLYPWGELIAGEDTDLAWRVRRRGAGVSFQPGAVVWHLATRTTIHRFLLRPLVVQIIPRLLPSIPELRQTYLWWRYFLSQLHLYFYVGLIGVLGTAVTGNWLGLLLGLPWLLTCWSWVFRPLIEAEGVAKGSARALMHIYVHLTSLPVLIYASLRYRRLVL